MRTDPDYLFPVRRTNPAPMRLRIAVPSWSFLGRSTKEAEPEPNRLSREEIMNLFQGELRAGKARKLTEAEQRDQDMQDSIRRALYPAGERTV